MRKIKKDSLGCAEFFFKVITALKIKSVKKIAMTNYGKNFFQKLVMN